MAEVVAEKDTTRAGKMYPILANRHLDTRIQLTIIKSLIVPPLEYAGEEWKQEDCKRAGNGSDESSETHPTMFQEHKSSSKGRTGDPIPTNGKICKLA